MSDVCPIFWANMVLHDYCAARIGSVYTCARSVSEANVLNCRGELALCTISLTVDQSVTNSRCMYRASVTQKSGHKLLK